MLHIMDQVLEDLSQELRISIGVWHFFNYNNRFTFLDTHPKLLQHLIERIEIDDHHYRHFYVNAPWFFPKQWSVDDMKKLWIYCGQRETC